MEDHDWRSGSLECLPPDPDAAGRVCVTYDLPGQPTQRASFAPSVFPTGAPLAEGQPVSWRVTGGKLEFKFPEPRILSDEELATLNRRARDTIIAGGAVPFDDAEVSDEG